MVSGEVSTAPAPDVKTSEGRRKWFTRRRKVAVCLLLVSGFLGYVAYSAKETYLVTAAHTRVGILTGQIQFLAARHQEPLTLEATVGLWKKITVILLPMAAVATTSCKSETGL